MREDQELPHKLMLTSLPEYFRSQDRLHNNVTCVDASFGFYSADFCEECVQWITGQMCVSVCVFQVLHSMVSSVERPPTIPAGSQLILRCKDFRVFQILIPQERDCLDVHASLVRLSRPGVCGKCVLEWHLSGRVSWTGAWLCCFYRMLSTHKILKFLLSSPLLSSPPLPSPLLSSPLPGCSVLPLGIVPGTRYYF